MLSGLLGKPAFAATRTSSLLVSVTVEAGCQISSAPSSAAGAASTANGWNAPVSVNCSFPVPYQVNVSSSAGIEPGIEHGIELASIGPPNPVVAGLPGFAHSQDFDPVRATDQPLQAAAEPETSLVEVSSGLLSSSESADEGTNRNADAPLPGTMTVTIVY
jgi:hypothetical protein